MRAVAGACAATVQAKGEGRSSKWSGERVGQARGSSRRGQRCQDGRGAWSGGQAAVDGWRHAALAACRRSGHDAGERENAAWAWAGEAAAGPGAGRVSERQALGQAGLASAVGRETKAAAR